MILPGKISRTGIISELVSIFGNFVNRTFVLMHKLCKGKVPVWHEKIKDEADTELIRQIDQTKITVRNAA